MVKKSIVVWNKIAEFTLQKAYREIKIESPQNAIKVRDGILAETRRLANGPEIYLPDKFKRDNPGNFELLRNTPTELLPARSSPQVFLCTP